MRTTRLLIGGLLLALIVLPGCGDDDEPNEEMANPASVFCLDRGGILEIREGDGGQHGVCIGPNGVECPEWDFYHGDCDWGDAGESGPAEPDPGAGIANPASEHCINEGGRLEIRHEAGGDVGYCIFPNGAVCEEWAYFHGECDWGDAGDPSPGELSAFCSGEGGTYSERVEHGSTVGYCTGPGMAECPALEFYQGLCSWGDAGE